MDQELRKAREHHVGRIIHMLSHQLKRRGTMPEVEMGLTPMQKHVLTFILFETMERDLYQRDIEEEFQIRRSTATGILQLLEKKGLLERRPVARDGRLKKLVLTPKALAIHQCIEERIIQSENDLYSCLTPEELEQFFVITDKLRHHLEKK